MLITFVGGGQDLKRGSFLYFKGIMSMYTSSKHPKSEEDS